MKSLIKILSIFLIAFSANAGVTIIVGGGGSVVYTNGFYTTITSSNNSVGISASKTAGGTNFDLSVSGGGGVTFPFAATSATNAAHDGFLTASTNDVLIQGTANTNYSTATTNGLPSLIWNLGTIAARGSNDFYLNSNPSNYQSGAQVLTSSNGVVTFANGAFDVINAAKNATNNLASGAYSPAYVLPANTVQSNANSIVRNDGTATATDTNIINALAQAVTNGLASISYVIAATNGLATTNYVNTATNGLVTAAVTNGLATTASLNSASNVLAAATASSVANVITNGQTAAVTLPNAQVSNSTNSLYATTATNAFSGGFVIGTGILPLGVGNYDQSTTIVSMSDNSWIRGIGKNISQLTVSNNVNYSFTVGTNEQISDLKMNGPFALQNATSSIVFLNNILQSSTIDGIELNTCTNLSINGDNDDFGSTYDSYNLISCSNITGTFRSSVFTNQVNLGVCRGLAYSGSVNCSNIFIGCTFGATLTGNGLTSHNAAIEFGGGATSNTVVLENCTLLSSSKNASATNFCIAFGDAQSNWAQNCTNNTVILYNCSFDPTKVLFNGVNGNRIIVEPSSYSGDGSGLTNLTPANLSAGNLPSNVTNTAPVPASLLTGTINFTNFPTSLTNITFINPTNLNTTFTGTNVLQGTNTFIQNPSSATTVVNLGLDANGGITTNTPSGGGGASTTVNSIFPIYNSTASTTALASGENEISYLGVPVGSGGQQYVTPADGLTNGYVTNVLLWTYDATAVGVATNLVGYFKTNSSAGGTLVQDTTLTVTLTGTSSSGMTKATSIGAFAPVPGTYGWVFVVSNTAPGSTSALRSGAYGQKPQ